jgi:hypothetical protein
MVTRARAPLHGSKYMYVNEIICLFSFKEILRQSPDHDVGPAIAHFLNCFLGKTLSASTKGSVGSTQSENRKVCYLKHSNLATFICLFLILYLDF